MLATLRQRNFALLWLGGLLSSFGDVALFIALPFYIYTLTGSAFTTGAMFIAQVVPSLVLGPVAGVFADRWDRKRTLVIVEALRTVLMLFLLLVRSPGDIWIVYLVVLVESAIGMFFDPAKNALLPQLVREEHVLPANALSSLSGQLTGLIAPLVGAALVGFIGFHGVVLLDSASYLLSALLLAFMVVPASTPQQDVAVPAAGVALWAEVWRDVRAGLRLVGQETWITGLFAIMSIVMLAQGIINVLFIPYIDEVLRGGPRDLGWIVTSQGMGGLIGSVIVGRFGRGLSPGWLIALSISVAGVGWVVMANTTSLPLVIAIFALMGVAASGVLITIPTLLQQGVAERLRGRIFGTLSMLQSVLLLVGMGLASVLADRLGVVTLFNVVAGLSLLAGVVAFLLRNTLPRQEATVGQEVAVSRAP